MIFEGVILDWWPIIAAISGVLIWVVRLEAAMIQQKKDSVKSKEDFDSNLEQERVARRELEARMLQHRSEDMINNQRSFDKIDQKLDTIGEDVKTLMRGE